MYCIISCLSFCYTYNMQIKISVVIPFYNVEKYAVQCLESVLSQSLSEIEVLCFDDGSTDGTLAILEAWQAKDSRIRIIKQENSGPSVARNKGLDMAAGEYVSFVDSDDILSPGALEKCYALACEYAADIIHFNADTMFDSDEYENSFKDYKEEAQRNYNKLKYIRSGYRSNSNKPLDGPTLFSAMVKNNDYKVPIWLCLFRNGFLKQHEFRFIDGIYHADEEFAFKTILSSKASVFCEEILYCRRLRPGSIMTTPVGRWNAVSRIIGQKQMQNFLMGIEPELSDEVINTAKQYLYNMKCLVSDVLLKYLSDSEEDMKYIEMFNSL